MKIVRYILFFMVLLVALSYIVWRINPNFSQHDESGPKVSSTHVAYGTLVVSLAANGVLESAVETPVRSEITGNLIDIAENNKAVKPGDIVFRLDPKENEIKYEEQARVLADAQEALNTLTSDSDVRIAQATGDVTIAEEAYSLAEKKATAEVNKIKAQVDFAKGELARAESELNRNKRLAAKNYIAGTILREAEQLYNKKQFDLEQQRTSLDDAEQRTSENLKDQEHALSLARLTMQSTRANIEQNLVDARIKIADAQRQLDLAAKAIEQCTITAPVAGLVVVGTNTENWPERRPYRLGDKVSSNAAPVVIYDLKQMQVRCQIGEIDIERVRKGQQVQVTSSTQRDKRYRGKIALVAELAREANVWQGGTPGKRVFGVLIKLDETDDNNLRPGMTVDLEIITDSVRNALLVPIRAVFKRNGQSVVYRVKNKRIKAIPVTVGKRNDLQIVVAGKLKKGDIISLEPVLDPSTPNKTTAKLPTKTGVQPVVSAKAVKGDLLFSVNQTGVVVAKRSIPVVPQISGRIQWISNDGLKVTKGSVLLQLETKQARENILNLTAKRDEVVRRLQGVTDVGDARTKQGKLEVTRAQNSATAYKRQNEVTLQEAQNQLEFDKQALEQRRSALEVKRRLAAKGLLPGSDVEREAVALRAAEFALQKEESNFILQKSQISVAAADRDKTVNDLIMNISRNRMRTSREVRMAKNELDNLDIQISRAKADLTKMTITVPESGLLMLAMQSNRGDARVLATGDWANQGRDVAAIVSLDQLQVKLELDQTQITGIKVSQQADVTIDALAGKMLKGKVTTIGQTARRPSVQGMTGISAYATFPVIIDLQPDKKSLVRPGMRAGVNIVVRKIKNVIMVPNESIFQHKGKKVVYVKQNGGYEPVNVKCEETNGEFTIITHGLSADAKVSLNDLDTIIKANRSTKGSNR